MLMCSILFHRAMKGLILATKVVNSKFLMTLQSVLPVLLACTYFPDLPCSLFHSFNCRHRIDHRDRRDRLENQHAHWLMQIERLVAVFLDYTMHADNCEPLTILPPMGDLQGIPLPTLDLVDTFCE